MNGLSGNMAPRRLSRETRHLLIAAFAALLALWILARLRFPERTSIANPIPPLLTPAVGATWILRARGRTGAPARAPEPFADRVHASIAAWRDRPAR